MAAPPTTCRVTVNGDRVYLMGAGGSLVAVDMKARKQSWSLETGLARGSAPLAEGNHVYVSAPDGRLLAVDARDGKLLGQTPARVGSGSAQVSGALPEPILANTHIYASAPDGTVFSVNARNPSAW